jgi:hypothetical protein
MGAAGITIDDSRFNGNVTLNTGAGVDVVNIETRDTGADLVTTFQRRLNIDLGAHDDTLTVGVAGQTFNSVHLGSPSTWNGGGGEDTLSLVPGQPLHRRPTIINFEIIV